MNKNNLYSIGDYAKLLGFSSETLRHYERIGIVTPQRDAKSGYRCYSPYDFTTLVMAKYLRSADFSLNEIKKIFSCDLTKEQLTYFDAKEADLLNQIELLTNKLGKIRTIKHDLIDSIRSESVVGIENVQPRWLIPIRKDDTFILDQTESCEASIHLTEKTDAKYAFVINQGVNGSDCEHYVGVSISATEEKPTENAIFIPGCSCLVYFLFKPWNQKLMSAMNEQILSKLKDVGFQNFRIIIGYEIMHSQHENGHHDITFKTYIPIAFMDA